MTKRFSILKLSEEDDSKIVLETHSHYEAKNRFTREPLQFGEQVVLRSHVNGDVRVVRTRDNGYCA